MSVTSLEPKNQGGGRSRPLSLKLKAFRLFNQGKPVSEVCKELGASGTIIRRYRQEFCELYGVQRVPLKLQVEDLAGQGLTSRQIAVKLDANLCSVRVYLSKWRARTGNLLREKELPPDVGESLALEAEDRKMTKKALVAALLFAIVKHELFSDILDTPR